MQFSPSEREKWAGKDHPADLTKTRSATGLLTLRDTKIQPNRLVKTPEC